MLSVLGMTIGDKRDCLKYRLQGSSDAVSSEEERRIWRLMQST